MARVFVIHGWGGSPNGKDWIPWAKNQLENKGYEVIAPAMPDTDNPRIETWVPYLKEVVGEPREMDILIGHSMGCQTILRFLEALPEGQKVNQVILVAGFVELMGLKEDELATRDAWLNIPLDLEKVKTKANQFTAIFSDNDPFVPVEVNKKVFEESLGAKIIVEHSKGHFSESDGIKELPVLLASF